MHVVFNKRFTHSNVFSFFMCLLENFKFHIQIALYFSWTGCFRHFAFRMIHTFVFLFTVLNVIEREFQGQLFP